MSHRRPGEPPLPFADVQGVVFIGDIHRRWDLVARGLAARPEPPRHVVPLGDMECHAPLDDLAAPLLRAGIGLHWIFGNHDYDGGPEMWANLADPARNAATAAGALHGRVVEIAGLRVAGLGGTFRSRVWNPPGPPRLHGRADLPADIATLGPGWSADSAAALAHSLAAMAIWPEDVEALAARSADVLVTHEAPSSHPAGIAVIDRLARAMGAKLIIHGHHHVGYRADAVDGLAVLGVAAAWGADLAGRVWWAGEKERVVAAPPAGWSYRGG
ncbi:MAG: metallophosphoesterase [Alphaproteobacteria bacterium]|nr:metallophosphoesterase [Alphaproteobacteria bacterium]